MDRMKLVLYRLSCFKLEHDIQFILQPRYITNIILIAYSAPVHLEKYILPRLFTRLIFVYF